MKRRAALLAMAAVAAVAACLFATGCATRLQAPIVGKERTPDARSAPVAVWEKGGRASRKRRPQRWRRRLGGVRVLRVPG